MYNFIMLIFVSFVCAFAIFTCNASLLVVGMNEHKKRPFLTYQLKLGECERVNTESDSGNIASNVFRNIQTLGKPSHCENMSSSEGSRVHEKASHTPTTLLEKPSDPVYHSASLLVRRGCLLVEE